MATRDCPLIFAVLAWGGAIAALYALLIQVMQPLVTQAPTVSLQNRMFAERYVYGHPAPNVLVGSSLTARLTPSVLGPRFTNLALSGEGALTGLGIVAASPAAPGRVYIEINQLGLGSDADLLRATFSEPGFTARRHVAALRKSYQPASLLYQIVRGRKDQDSSGGRTMTVAQRQGVVDEAARGLERPLPQARLDTVLAELKTDIADLRRRGIKPVFYEMPIDPQLRGLAAPLQMRDLVRAAFPPAANCWIDVSLRNGFTLDGQHLADAGVTEAAALFRTASPCER